MHKKRILEVVNNMSEQELEKVSELLRRDQMDREDITSEDLERAAELAEADDRLGDEATATV